MDRAGLVGADGATHCGAFDVTYMASLPDMVCMAPSNEAELINMVRARAEGVEVGGGWVGGWRAAHALGGGGLCRAPFTPLKVLTSDASTEPSRLIRLLLPACLLDLLPFSPSCFNTPPLQVATSVAIDDAPSCFRFPRGNGVGIDLAAEGISADMKGKALEVGGGLLAGRGRLLVLVWVELAAVEVSTGQPVGAGGWRGARGLCFQC
jgi:hypothetical protein